ncbi:DNA repair-scaffolding protein-like isoform X2 [Oscarella lobularis]|uniref:DNA repair-scaffolding protein-like isoform X2 n=1 Tax=Oscarella lobularis TaxID=121494 RepID=UPI003313FF13
MSFRKAWEKLEADSESLLSSKRPKSKRDRKLLTRRSPVSSEWNPIERFSSDEEGVPRNRAAKLPKRRRLFDSDSFRDFDEIKREKNVREDDIEWEVSDVDVESSQVEEKCVDMATEEENVIEDFEKSSPEEEVQTVDLKRDPEKEVLSEEDVEVELCSSRSLMVTPATDKQISHVKQKTTRVAKTPIDSAKKKRKFRHLKTGLAERLERLVSREKSDVAFWRHKSRKNEDESVILEVDSLHREAGLLVTQCRQISGKPLADGKGSEDSRLLNIILTLPIQKHLKLMKGSQFKMYPPWQELFVPEPVIFCVYYCCTLPNQPSPKLLASPKKTVQLVSPIKYSHRVAGLDDRADGKRARETASKSDHSLVSVDESVAIHGALSDTILIHGTVQRLYRKSAPVPTAYPLSKSVMECVLEENRTTSTHRCSLLVQDCKQLCCEILLPEHVDETQLCSGKPYLFSNLCPVERMSLFRHPLVKSLVDSLQQGTYSPQKYFYVLTWPSGESMSVEPCNSEESPLCKNLPSYCDHVLLDRDFLERGSPVGHRISIATAQIIFHTEDYSHLCLRFCRSHLVCFLRCHKSFSRHSARPILQSSNFLCVKDLVVADTSQDNLVFVLADAFTSVETVDVDEENRDFETPQIPFLSDSSVENSFVSLSGSVSDVDTDSAFVWPICTKCTGDNLEEIGQTNEFYCTDCELTGVPDIAVQLQVYVNSDNFPPHVRVKLQLLQSTIKRLLPHTPLTQGGCDAESVVGQRLPSMTCFIRHITRTPHGLKEFVLEELVQCVRYR